MIIKRYLNGKPITAEELARLNLTNATLERIIAAVRARMELSLDKN